MRSSARSSLLFRRNYISLFDVNLFSLFFFDLLLDISLPIPTTDEDLVLDFPLWITVAGNRATVILLLDGIDRLDTTYHYNHEIEWRGEREERESRADRRKGMKIYTRVKSIEGTKG